MTDDRTPVNILDQAKSWFAAAWEKVAPGESIRWDVSFSAFPDQSGQMIAFVISYAEIAGVVMGTVMGNTAIVQPFSITEEHTEKTVRDQYAALQQGRSSQLQAMQQQADQAQGNGQRPPASGLVIPGS